MAFALIGGGLVLLFFKEILIGLVDRHPNWKPESWADYCMQNIFELLEYVLSYFSNTVSFLRVGAFVIAAIVTPPDVMSQCLLAIPLVILYQVGLWCVCLFGKKDPQPEAES